MAFLEWPRMQRVLTPWAPHTPCPNLPSIPAARLRWAAIQPLRQTVISILNTSYNPASFSYWVAQAIRPFVVSRHRVTDDEAAEWLDEFARLEGKRGVFLLLDAGSDGGGEGRLTRRC